MAKKKRVTRKQLLKEPDEFISTTGKLINLARHYEKQISIAAGAFCILLIFIAGYRYFSDKAENNAFLLLDQAVYSYEAEKGSSGEISAYQATKDDFEYLINKYDDTHGGKLARIVFGRISYEAGETETAIQQYEKSLADFDTEATVKNLLLSSLGYAYEKKKDYHTAVSYFQKILDGNDPVMKDMALFNIGRLYFEIGDQAKGKEAFRRLIADYTDSIYYELAKEKVTG